MNTLIDEAATQSVTDLVLEHPPSVAHTRALHMEFPPAGAAELTPLERIALALGRALVAWSRRRSYDPRERAATSRRFEAMRARIRREERWQLAAALDAPRR
jgi:hypothetical protein